MTNVTLSISAGIMTTATNNRRNGIQWIPWTHLDDVDFEDDFAPLSHTKAQMQEKMNAVTETSARIGLDLDIAKTKILRTNTTSYDTLNMEGKEIEEVDNIIYLGSIVNQKGGAERDIKARIGKAKITFLQLGNIWKSKGITTRPKIRPFNSNVEAVLLYG